MKKNFKILLSIVFAVLMLSSYSLTAKTHLLTILHTNDHHGHFAKFNPYPVKDVGGLAAQSTLVNIVRAETEKAGGHVLLLSGGDINTGIPESDLQDAEPDIIGMNLIGYDAMALGNHEFDNSREILLRQKRLAKFAFLSANTYFKAPGKGTLVDPYIIKEIGGLKVAIFGLTPEDTDVLTLPEYTKDLEFRNPIAISKKLVPKLRKQADLIIALTHIGYYENEPQKGDTALAKAVPDIDVIVGGHTHTKLKKPVTVGKTIIVQAGGYSEYVGRLDLTIDTATKRITHDYELLPVNMKKRVKFKGKKYYQFVGTGYVEDAEMLKAMEPFVNKANSLLTQPIGKAKVALEGGKKDSRSKETNLGNLIADAMRAKTEADIAIQNSGGIRASIAPGEITYRDVLTVQPFGNTLVLLNMTGAQITEALNHSASQRGHGAFAQVSGLSFTIEAGKAKKVMVGKSPINLEKTYKVVTNNFMGVGGDGYKMLKPLAKVDTGFVDADAFKEYIQSKSSVSPKVEGRITIVE